MSDAKSSKFKATNKTIQNQSNDPQGEMNKYYNLYMNGLGYLNQVRKEETEHGSMISATISIVQGRKDAVSYLPVEIIVSGSETEELIANCQAACNEQQKVLIGFRLSNLNTRVAVAMEGRNRGELRAELKARLIRVFWVRINGEVVYKAGDSENGKTSDGSEDIPF